MCDVCGQSRVIQVNTILVNIIVTCTHLVGKVVVVLNEEYRKPGEEGKKPGEEGRKPGEERNQAGEEGIPLEV